MNHKRQQPNLLALNKSKQVGNTPLTGRNKFKGTLPPKRDKEVTRPGFSRDYLHLLCQGRSGQGNRLVLILWKLQKGRPYYGLHGSQVLYCPSNILLITPYHRLFGVLLKPTTRGSLTEKITPAKHSSPSRLVVVQHDRCGAVRGDQLVHRIRQGVRD